MKGRRHQSPKSSATNRMSLWKQTLSGGRRQKYRDWLKRHCYPTLNSLLHFVSRLLNKFLQSINKVAKKQFARFRIFKRNLLVINFKYIQNFSGAEVGTGSYLKIKLAIYSKYINIHILIINIHVILINVHIIIINIHVIIINIHIILIVLIDKRILKVVNYYYLHIFLIKNL